MDSIEKSNQVSGFLDEQSFQRILECPRAMVFLHSPWSVPSVKAMKVFDSWNGGRELRGVKIGKLDMDSELPHVTPFLSRIYENQKVIFGGYGELVWLGSGKPIDVMVSGHTPDSIDEKTLSHWPDVIREIETG